MSTLIFEAELPGTSEAADVIRRQGKVFAVGHYSDKGFSLSMDEARAAVAAFEPVPANLSHHRTVADGRCGTLESVELQPDGSITGTFAEPSSFAQWLGDGARKLSLEWDKATKRIVGVAHALNPRIPDAVVFEAVAAFEKGETPAPLAEFAYDTAKERDKIAPEDFGDPANKLFPCRTQQEFRQCIENLAMANDPTAVKSRLLSIAEAKGFEVDLTNIIWPRSGVSVPIPVASFEHKENPMSKNIEPPEGSAPPAKSAVELELEAAQAKIAAFEAKEAQRVTDEARGRATAFADSLVASQRIVARGNEDYQHAVALFAIAEQFDAERPQLACFDDTFKPSDVSAVAAVKAIFERLPEHGKNTEAVTDVPEAAVALFERAVTKTNESQSLADLNQEIAGQIIAAREEAAKSKK